MPPPQASLPSRRKVFISYHHRGDQESFDYFSRLFGEIYEIFHDESLDGRIRSDDLEYVERVIREEHIVGSSITIVLCGAETWKRKYVDWEIRSTLHHQHALLGVKLPSAPLNANGKIVVPSRLNDNIQSGYAVWTAWTEDANQLRLNIEQALAASASTSLIRNGRAKMERNHA